MIGARLSCVENMLMDLCSIDIRNCSHQGLTGTRQWTQRKLLRSYRLTPKVAKFINAFWGTDIQGANTKTEDLPVEYLCRLPYPGKREAPDLPTQFLAGVIDKHGPENVMFLAQSVKSDKCPIRIHVNNLLGMKDADGTAKYNFDVKNRDYDTASNSEAVLQNKVRVWTFCGAKGCEADTVVVFGFDTYAPWRIKALNQMCVALSRARKRLIVVHGRDHKNRGTPYPFYPVGGRDLSVTNVQVGDAAWQVPQVDGDQVRTGDQRIRMAAKVVEQLRKDGIIKTDESGMPTTSDQTPVQWPVEGSQPYDRVYHATDFEFFSAEKEKEFLNRAETWRLVGQLAEDSIELETQLKLGKTTEDVSAVYGTALNLMLQWHSVGFCPEVEAVVGGRKHMLGFEPRQEYTYPQVLDMIHSVDAMASIDSPSESSAENKRMFQTFFRDANGKAFGTKRTGSDLIALFNRQLRLTKTLQREDGATVVFRVKAIEDRLITDDLMQMHVPQIKIVYAKADKTAADWCFIANAVMAFNCYHHK